MSITLTEPAIQKIKEIIQQDHSLADKALRVYVEAGGCSGYSYGFRFDEAASGDNKLAYEGFNLIIDQESQKLMEGAVVDYKEEFGHEGFAIKNPNAKKSCGCGNSFEA